MISTSLYNYPLISTAQLQVATLPNGRDSYNRKYLYNGVEGLIDESLSPKNITPAEV